MIELGRAQKSIFLARYLRKRHLQREIHEGLNVVEHGIARARSSSTARAGSGRDEQEMSVLCLRILQAALVYVNTMLSIRPDREASPRQSCRAQGQALTPPRHVAAGRSTVWTPGYLDDSS